MRIGPYQLPNNVAVAPMAGVTDRPFRVLCRRLGAGYAVSEMVASNPRLRETGKSRLRIDHAGESAPIAVQIAGADPETMADAARYNVDHGAQIIDLNMGCPAKKVCNVAAGSALLANEPLVARILAAVVAAVDVPVTLKIRTGAHPGARNAVAIARIAQDAGVQALTVHGRTRACLFVGAIDYDTIAAVKRAVAIPVIANGDIDGPETARAVLRRTGADAVMIGRAAQGRPWIFREIVHFLATGAHLAPPTIAEARALIVDHLHDHYAFYGEVTGTRTARKHLGWYAAALPDGEQFRRAMCASETTVAQLACVTEYFDRLEAAHACLPGSRAAAGSTNPDREAGRRQQDRHRAGEALAA